MSLLCFIDGCYRRASAFKIDYQDLNLQFQYSLGIAIPSYIKTLSYNICVKLLCYSVTMPI